jgi:hypothetical protein
VAEGADQELDASGMMQGDGGRVRPSAGNGFEAPAPRSVKAMLRRCRLARPAWATVWLSALLTLGASPGLHPHPDPWKEPGAAALELAPAGSDADLAAPHVCLLCLVHGCSSVVPATSVAQAAGSVRMGISLAQPWLSRRTDLPRRTGRAPPETGQS